MAQSANSWASLRLGIWATRTSHFKRSPVWVLGAQQFFPNDRVEGIAAGGLLNADSGCQLVARVTTRAAATVPDVLRIH